MAASRPPAPSVGDLIEVPELRTVVRLQDLDDPAQARGLASSFVFTDDALRALRLLRRSFHNPAGEGFFLIGSYGSGKSHLLAVLALWAEGGVPAETPAELGGGPLFPRRLLGVRVSLVEHRGADPLEECVLRAAERRLDALGRSLALTPARQYLERLAEALGPDERARLDAFLEARRQPPFARLSRSHPGEAVALGREFLRQRAIELPARLHDERPALLERLVGAARDQGFEGVLLLVDELSEFLRSKPTSRALSEDARFLQFLGEAGRSLPLWVVASLQETLEESTDVARPVLDKIKDRYPVRLRLSTTHVEELVASRLVRKKPGAESVLADIHRRLMAHYPDLKLSEERFRRLYPLHPRTLAYLEGLADLFSQARGVVDFVTTQLRGDPLRGYPGLVGEEASALLGVDRIFDHFEARLREHETYAPYHRKAYQHLVKRIGEIYSDPEERAMALRLVKILVLTELNPLEGRKSVKELAEMLLTRVSDLDPALNYQYLEEAILGPLYASADYLRREPGAEPHTDRYGLDLALDVRSLLRERTAALLAATRGEEPRLLRRLLAEVGGGPIPLDRLARAEPVAASVRWLNTDREGLLLLGEPADLGEERLKGALASLEGEEADFLLLLREPGQEPRPLPAPAERPEVLVWTPAPCEGESLQGLLEAAARRAMLAGIRGGTEEEVRLKELLAEEVEKETPRVRESLGALYLQGSLSSGRQAAGLLPFEAPGTARNLEEAVTPAVGRALAEAHPEFRRVMPQSEFVNPRALAQALSELGSAGSLSVSAARSRNLLNVVEGVLLPLGLVSLKRGSYALSPDETPGSLVHGLLADLAEADRLGFTRVFLKLRKGPFGLTTMLARTLLLALLQAGHIVGLKGGKAVQTQYLSYETLGSLEELALGKLVDPGRQAELRRLGFLFPSAPPEFWGLKTQRDVWRWLVDFKEKTALRLDRLAEAGSRYRSVGALQAFDWERLERLTAPLARLAQGVYPSHDSRRGIEAALDAQREAGLEEPMLRALDRAERFFGAEVEKVLFVHGYLADPALDALPDPWAGQVAELRGALGRLTELVLEGDVPSLVDRFERFRDGYRQAYAAAHATERGPAGFVEIERVKATPEMRALEALGAIETLSAPHDHARLSRILERTLQQRCGRDAVAELYTKPTCACAFRLGDTSARPPVAELRALGREGIVEYAAELHEPERRAQVLAHAAALEGTDREATAGALRKLVRALDKGAEARDLLLLVDRSLGEALAEALRGRAPVVERDIQALVERLAERKLKVERLREEFERWLAASKLDPGTYVHVIEGPGGGSGSGGAAAGPPRLDEALADDDLPVAQADAAAPAPAPAAPARKIRRPQLLAQGLRAWALARGLDAEAVARRLQLAESPPPADPGGFLVRHGRDLEQALGRDPALREGLREILGLDRLDAPALVGELVREPALEGLRSLALDRATTLVLAGEARASALPDLGKPPLPLPRPGMRPGALELHAVLRHALVVAEARDPEPAELLTGLLGLDAAATLATRTGALEPATVRALLERAAKLQARAAQEPPQGLSELPALLEEWDPGEPLLVLLVDALRFDLGRALRPVLEEALGRKVAREELRLAPLPSTTEAARARLLGVPPGEDPAGVLGARGIAFVAAAERGHHARALRAALTGSEASRRVVWLNTLDDKIHASSLSPWGLVEAVANECALGLAAELQQVPRRHRVILTADHGFRDNPAWPRARERYLHGGGSLLERAVPWLVFGP